MDKISQALYQLYQQHRIVFWYDEKAEFTSDYQQIALDGVSKIEVHNNQLAIKHRIAKQEPKQKFLLYFAGPKPSDENNWLLDQELAHQVFSTHQEALFLQDLGLEHGYKDLLSQHLEFFKSTDRRLKLKELLSHTDSWEQIKHKMLAVLFGTQNISLASYIHAHAVLVTDGALSFDKELEKYNLADYYWGLINQKYNYSSLSPTIYDFLLEVFEANFVLGKNHQISKESRLLLALWKDSLQYRKCFGQVSDKIAQDKGIVNKLEASDIDSIIQDDLFGLVDKKVIHQLVDEITHERISTEKLLQYVKQRENKYWYQEEFEKLYQSLVFASQMITLVREYAQTKYQNLAEGTSDYAQNLYQIDLLYRQFIYTYRQAKQNKILANLATKVEKVYANDWLLIYNNNWQTVIDGLSDWSGDTLSLQSDFFANHVKPIIQKNQRLFVIISDALRYECGAELLKKLQSENRYQASIEHMVTGLPSYTQLGMAALLPHQELSIAHGSDLVLADGMATNGLQARSKILETNAGVRATAIKAEDLMSMNSGKEGRDFVKQYDLIYIYHNRIDKTGDDKTSEEKVFEAVEEEFIFLMDLLKKISNMNGNNMIITADHGFVYQHNVLEESDFSQSNHSGQIWKENRRFVLGQNLSNDKATKAFTSQALGLQAGVEVLIPKSINRLRVKGAGSRFIHGGASLQEIVIPVIKINKTRQDTVSHVDIDIIKSTDRITTNILAVSFMQNDLVTEQVLPRSIRAFIKAEDGSELSDQFKYNFDIDEGSERQREVKHRFQLSNKAGEKYKNQRVQLVLEEPVEDSTQWKPYKEYYYTLNISFTNDFDDF